MREKTKDWIVDHPIQLTAYMAVLGALLSGFIFSSNEGSSDVLIQMWPYLVGGLFGAGIGLTIYWHHELKFRQELSDFIHDDPPGT